MLWEHEPNFHKCFYNSIKNMENMFSISFRKHSNEKKNNLLTLIIKMSILFAYTIIMSTAHTSSVFLSSYGNTIFNQSAHIFSYDCFLIHNNLIFNYNIHMAGWATFAM